MRSFYLLLILISALPFTLQAQYFTIDTVKGESPYNKQFSFIFPQLKSKTDQVSADVINKDMVKEILQLDLGQQKRSIFENIWGSQELDLAAVSDISFKVLNNDEKFFCISISYEGCGAYCEHQTVYYVRESSSGKAIALSQLLTGKGMQLLSDSVKYLAKSRIEKRIADMTLTVKADPLSPEDKDYYAMAIAQYGECLKSMQGREVDQYTLNNSMLTIYLDSCLPHAIRSFDQVDYSFSFDINTFKDYLTDYGRSLLKQ